MKRVFITAGIVGILILAAVLYQHHRNIVSDQYCSTYPVSTAIKPVATLNSNLNKRVLPTELAWPGFCTQQAWKNNGTVVGFFGFGLVEWNAKNWQQESYHPLNDVCEDVFSTLCSLSADGKYLVVNSEWTTSRVIDTATARTLMLLGDDKVWSKGYFGQNNRILAEVRGNVICIWDFPARRIICTIKSRSKDFHKVLISPNGRLLLASDQNGDSSVWDIPSGRLTYHIAENTELHGPFAFSEDSSVLAAIGNDKKRYKGLEVLLWNTDKGKLLYRFADPHGYNQSTHQILFADNDKRLLLCGESALSVRDASNGKSLKEIALQNTSTSAIPHSAFAFAISPDGKTLAAGSQRFSIPEFKLISSNHVYQVSPKSLSISADGSTLVAMMHTGEYAIWNMKKMALSRWILPTFGSMTISPEFVGNHEFAANGCFNKLITFNSDSGKVVRVIEPADKKQRIYISRASKTIAGISDTENTAEIWKYNGKHSMGKTKLGGRHIYQPVISPNGEWLFARGFLSNLRTKKTSKVDVEFGRFSSDSSMLAGYTEWRIPNRDRYAIILDTDGKELHRFGKAEVYDNLLAAFSTDDTLVAIVTGSSIGIYRTDNWQRVSTLSPAGQVGDIAFDPQKRFVAGTTGLGVTLWDINTGKVMKTLIASLRASYPHKPDFWMVLDN